MNTERSYLWGAFKSKTVAAMATPKLSAGDSRIISQLAKEFEDRSRKDIQTWRDGMQAASDPNTPKWAPLQDLLKELRIDGHLGGEIALRKAAVKSTRFYIADSKTGEEDPEKTKFFKKKWFYKLMDEILEAPMMGYTIMELVNPVTFEFKLVPRRNCIPQQGIILKEAMGSVGIPYKTPQDANFIIEVIASEFGILNDIVPQLIWKRNAQQTWAEFSEKFGIPMVTVETNKSEKKDLDRIEAMLSALGQSWSGIIPEGSTLTIHDVAGKSDPYNIWDRQIERCNSEISKRVLSGTMVTDNGSSRSQSEVHERNMDDKISEEDRLLVEFTFEDIKPLLMAHGAPISETDEFIFDRSESISMTEHWTIVQGLLNNYEADDKLTKWISKRFGGIPISTLKASGGATPANFKKPSAILVEGGMAISLPNYTAPSCCAEHDRFPEAVTNVQQKILDEFSDKMAETTYKHQKARILVAQKTAVVGNIIREGLMLEWKRLNDKSTSASIGFAYDSPDYRALGLMELNLFHFSFAKNLAELQKYNELLIDGDKIRSFNDFMELVKKDKEIFNTTWARTEYNFAVAVGQNTSAYLQAMSQIKEFPYSRYQTVGDSNVRDEHAALNNKVFALSDMQARRVWPPNGYGCRCEMLQVPGTFDSNDKATGVWAIQQLTSGKNDNYVKQFMVNRGDVGQVFMSNQFYTKNKIENFSKAMNEITFSDYNLEKSSVIREKLKTSLKLDVNITEVNKDKLFKGDKVMEFSDYIGRKMAITKSNFDKHTVGDKYIKDKRHQLFAHLGDVFEKPDEVYFVPFAQDLYQIRYIKHYNNMTLVIDSEFKQDKMIIKTWYPLKTNDENKRFGLLIKQNP